MDPITITAIVLTIIGYGIYSLIKYVIDTIRGVKPEAKRFSVCDEGCLLYPTS
jgi:hypothetical protein